MDGKWNLSAREQWFWLGAVAAFLVLFGVVMR